jgi:amidase
MIIPKITSALCTLLLAFSLATSAAAADGATRNSPSPDVPTRHNEATVAQLQAEMAAGKLTSKSLTKEYKARNGGTDKKGPGVNALIPLNPDALNMARHADQLAGMASFSGIAWYPPYCSKTTSTPATR